MEAAFLCVRVHLGLSNFSLNHSKLNVVAAASQTLTFSSAITDLSRLMTAVDEFGRQMSATSADVSALQLALEEIVSNVCTHGYQGEPHRSLTVTLEAAGANRIRATVADLAIAFNPLTRSAVNTNLSLEERPLGGLGVHLVRKVMDVCIYERRDGQNIFTIERKLRHGSGRSALTHIGVTKFGSSAVLALTGRLEGHSSPELEQQVNALLHSGIRSLIFDLSALEYVSSAGLRVFILAAKKLKSAGGDARFAALTAWVREVFHVSGLLTTLEVVPTVESVLPITPPAATRPK